MRGEKCGVFGIYSPGQDVARLTCYGLSALQHRGQESSGIVVTDGEQFRAHIKPGLVAQVFNDEILDGLEGFAAIGHNRYSTSGSKDTHLQPVLRNDDVLSLAHNGNLPSVTALKKFLSSKKVLKHDSNDSELMTDVIRYFCYQGLSTSEAIQKSWPFFTGAFSCLLLDQDKLYAFRDQNGVRPLSIAKLNGGYVVASETCAFDTIGAKFIRDIRPGELLEISDQGLKSTQVKKGQETLEVFEYVYFSRPDSMLQGQSVNEVRRRLGARLAKEAPVEADVVIPIPDSATPAALGFSRQSGIEFDFGLIKNRYIHRTFITPDQRSREKDVHLKLNPLAGLLKGRRVVIVDDSIVRATTMSKIIKLVREAGAVEVHIRISSPPVLYPDFYGIDTPDQSQLIAARLKEVKKIKRYLGATTLAYLSYEGLVEAIGVNKDQLCLACFDGIYPIDLLDRKKEVKRAQFSF